MRLARLALALLGLVLLGPAQAASPEFEAALRRLATENFAEIEAGIGAVAATGDPAALPTLQALAEGRLAYRPSDRAVLIREPSGAVLDARTGASGAAGATRPVRLNNRVRRALDAALGSLTLLAPDPARRLAAAESVFKARDAAALPALAAALARETDERVKRALRQAQAAALLAQAETPDNERIAAFDAVAERGDGDALGLLRAQAGQATGVVRDAALDAAAAIERRLTLLSYVQNLWHGLSLGSVLLLAAIGLAVTFGVMGVINMAHGEMMMLGAYTTFVVQEAFRARAPHLFDWSLPVALPLAFAVAALVGIAIERGIIRHLYGRPLETLLATWGVSLILQQAVRSGFGPSNREVGAPSYMAGSVDLGGVAVAAGRFWIVLFALAVFAALLLVLKATPFGLKMRAVTQNRRMAAAMGIRTPWVDCLTFALGSGIAGIAGVALSQIDNVSPNLGQATSSTRSWWWCSAASATCGGRSSRRSPSASRTRSWSRWRERFWARSCSSSSSSSSSRSARGGCSP
jgi:urea transport system permease protein